MADETNRRSFLGKSLIAAAAAGAIQSLEEHTLLSALGAEVADDAGEREEAARDPMPCGRIGKLEMSRLIIGGNLIAGFAHARDLIYVSRLFKAYNTDQRVIDTFELAEQCGINTVLINPTCQEIVSRYNKERGGRMQTIVAVKPDADEAQTKEIVSAVVDAGADTIYTHGEITDRFVRAGNLDPVAKTLDMIRQAGLPAGVGSHSLETPKASEKHGLDPDYYVKTFHPTQYWSATPEENRKEWCWYESRTGDHDEYFDNIYCLNPEETAAFMEKVEKPWIAFKVMAAGAIHPRQGFANAYRGGADFICAGMFDFQVAEDAKLAKDLLRKIDDRPRPWRA
jgi:hypothetical protein